MNIEGTIECIIYRNESNGYTVFALDSKPKDVVAVAKLPNVSEGERVRLTGEFQYNKKYGEQFVCSKAEILKQETEEGIERYLSSGLIKGVGPITAHKIVSKFGKNTLEVIEFCHTRLAEIDGISPKKAQAIFEEYNNIKDMQNAIIFLQEYDISTNLSIKIYNIYKNNTIQVVKDNPYKLIEDIDGVGFLTADRIAQNLGIEKDSNFRIRAGIVHELKNVVDKEGNTYVKKKAFFNQVARLLGLAEDDYYLRMDNLALILQMDNIIRIFELEGEEVIMLSKYYYMERTIASILHSLHNNQDLEHICVDKEIEFFESLNNLTLHTDQKNAISTAINSGVCVITGGPGTGKTTIVKCILSILKGFGKKVKLLAPTGRAAKRLSESTDMDASTIHRALEVVFNDGYQSFYYNEHNKMPFDCFIVDEVSMIDATLMFHLLKAIDRGAMLILVGDKDQLPSVGAGNVLADILNCKHIACAELTHIYRQQDDSLIITNAHLINNGKEPIINNNCLDFFFAPKDELQDIADDILALATRRIPNHFNIDKSKIQVLAPMRNGVCGIDNLNKLLQEQLNPPKMYKNELDIVNTIYRVGDKVMQTSNNYQMEWEKLNSDHTIQKGNGVFNGDIGVIEEINRENGESIVLFEDGRRCTYLKSDIKQLSLSYAITIHKSQGCEFDAVIMPLVAGTPQILTKNLLYTAVTRAKKLVVLVGKKANMMRMIKNNHIEKRYSMLGYFLEEIFNKTSTL